MPTSRSSKSWAPVSPSSTSSAVIASASSPSATLPEKNAAFSHNHVSQTDWEYVRRMQETDAPIPYDPNDPDDGPYDPNDDAAVDAYWDSAIITQGLSESKPQKATPKQLVSLRLSKNVLDFFRGPGWQARIDEALQEAARTTHYEPMKPKESA